MRWWRYMRLRKELMRAAHYVVLEARNPHTDNFGYAVVDVNRGAWNRLDQVVGWIEGDWRPTDPGRNDGQGE